MKDFIERDEFDIDALLEEVAADPSRAAAVKAELQRRLRAPAAPRPAAPGAAAPAGTAAEDPDSFWDNMPV